VTFRTRYETGSKHICRHVPIGILNVARFGLYEPTLQAHPDQKRACASAYRTSRSFLLCFWKSRRDPHA